MHVEDFYDNFLVRSWVESSGSATAAVACGASGCNHAVEVENWSTLPYDVDVETVIAGSVGPVSFSSSGASMHSWTAAIRSLASGESDASRQSLLCSNFPGRGRIHCVRVDWKKAGRHRWRLARGTYPLALTVAVT